MRKFPKSKEQEDKLKDKIFDIYNNCVNETSSDRRQTLVGQLWEYIYKWCRDFLPYDVDKLGMGIGNIARRITNKETKANVPKDKNDFFAYLNTCIKKEQDDFLRKYGEDDISSSIHIPKGQKQKVKEVKSILRTEETKLRRELTSEEEKRYINEWYNDDNAYQKYIEIKNAMNVVSIYQKTGDDEINLLDTVAAMPYMENLSDSTLNEKMIKLKEKYKEAAEFVLSKKYEKTKPFYRELFTLYCIIEFDDYSFLTSLLDENIIKAYQKSDKKITYKEITKKHKPTYSEDSLSSYASEKLNKEILDRIKAYLTENQ